jgi:lysophospholipase L1-like esterase
MRQSLILLMLTLVLGSTVGDRVEGATKKESGKQKITVFIVGDSTVSSYPSNFAPLAGWGQFIGRYFAPEITIKNAAIAGRSSKSFINEGRLDKVAKEIKAGDYLLIQFGHNDENKDKPERYADADTTYKECLKKFIDAARQRGAMPVLITPVEQRRFDADGRILATHGKYPEAMKQLGRNMFWLLI